MKNRSTLFILIGIVVLGLFIWAQESYRARDTTKVLEHQLFNLDVETLLSLEFHHANGVVRFEKKDGVWMAGDLDKGSGRADVGLVSRMVSGLNGMGKGTTITAEQLSVRGLDSSEYGFAPPSARVIATDNLGRHEWLIGRRSPLGDQVYAKVADENNIYTISDKISKIIPATADLLRDRSLFPGSAAAVKRFEIRGASGFARLVKEPKGEWRLRQPIDAAADPKEIDGFLQMLYAFRVEEFVADDVADFLGYGLQGETRRISVGAADGSTRVLIIGDDATEKPGFVYARRDDAATVFTMSADVLKLVNAPAERFRDASVLTVPLATVSSVSIGRGEERLKLVVDEDRNWKISSPVVWDADPQAVANLILLWNAAVITEFSVSTNQVAAEWTLEVGSEEAGVTNRVEILPTNGDRDGLLIRRDGDPTSHRVNLPMVPDGIANPLAYKGKQVWAIRGDQLSKVSLRRGETNEQVIERLEDGSFAPVGTNGLARLNEEAFGRLLRVLRDVRTSGYITHNPRDLEIYGLASPLAELHIGLSGSNELGRVLLVGRETPQGFYSMVKGRDVVFYLESPVVNALTADLVKEVEPAAPSNE